MNKVQCASEIAEPAVAAESQGSILEPQHETADERVTRIYAHEGGPLVGWLLDECRRRGQLQKEMAQQLGVTSGYINLLRSGLRKTEHISREFAVSCARYLGVPPVVVMIVSGRISMSDFVSPAEPEHVALERAFDAMRADPMVRAVLPMNLEGLSLDAKKALVLFYSNSLGHDVLGLRELPETVPLLRYSGATPEELETGSGLSFADGQ